MLRWKLLFTSQPFIRYNLTLVGTWFDDQKILDDAKDMWRRMGEDTRRRCSQDYFEFKVRSLPEYVNAEKVRFIPIPSFVKITAE